LALAGIIIGFALIGIFILVVALAVAFGHETCTNNSHHTIVCSNN
jgi:hypothetical protein